MTSPVDMIPVIDISGSKPEAEVAKELVDAAATCGFVFIKNEGKNIPVDEIEKTFDLSRKFFASPLQEKEKCKISENNKGWAGMHSETLDARNQRVGDFKEVFNLAEFISDKPQQPLPALLQPHEADLKNFQSLCQNLCLKILDLFAIGLEVEPKTWFSARHHGGPSGTILRLLYYPSIPSSDNFDPSLDRRAGAHSDYGSVTLLFQRPGQPGLEILPPSSSTQTKNQDEENWVPVQVQPPSTASDPSPPILVNIGDLLSYWTNGLFKSTMHRVVFPTSSTDGKSEDRYSIAYFCHPVSEYVLESVPSERVKALAKEKGDGKEGKEEKKKMTAGEHLLMRLKATYLDLYKDEE